MRRFKLLRIGTLAIACAVLWPSPVVAQNSFPLTVVSVKRFADAAGNVVVIGEVLNENDLTVTIPKAVVTLNGAQTTTHQVEVLTSSARKLSGLVFAYALPPKQRGFFRFSTNVPNATISSHSVTADGQQLFTALPMKASLSVIVSQAGSQYTLRISNQSQAAIAYNIRSAVGGTLNGVLEDVDLSGTPGAGGASPCTTAMVMPQQSGVQPVEISDSFSRTVSAIAHVALKWDEIYVEPSAFAAPAAGGVGDIRVASQCAWTAQSQTSWITIIGDTSGTGDGFVRISAPANPTTVARTGTLTIAGLTVRVEQAAGTGNTFTDPQLSSRVTPVRIEHVSELRSRIQALRSRFQLGAFQWTDDPLAARATPIRAVHLTQLRQALADVYVAAKRTPPSYTDSTLTAGVAIKAAHISELRAAVLAIE